MRILLKILIAGLLLVLVLALATEVVALHPSPTPTPAHRAHAVLVRKLPNSNEPPKTVQPVIR